MKLTENGVPPSGNTRAVVGQSVAGCAPGVVRSKWRRKQTLEQKQIHRINQILIDATVDTDRTITKKLCRCVGSIASHQRRPSASALRYARHLGLPNLSLLERSHPR